MQTPEPCVDAGDYCGFNEALKTVYGPSHQVQSPLCSADGQTLLTDKASIINRWLERYQTSTNCIVQGEVILSIPQKPVKMELNAIPSLVETIKAIKQLKSSEAAGVDGIPPEIRKHGGRARHTKLHKLFVCGRSQKDFYVPQNSECVMHQRANEDLVRLLGTTSTCRRAQTTVCPQVVLSTLLCGCMGAILPSHVTP